MSLKYSVKVCLSLFVIPIIATWNLNLYSAGNQPEIIVYGNTKCGYCKEIIQLLENDKIPFIFRDVELNGAFQEEMFSKLRKAGHNSTAYFPVIDVGGQILMRPKFDDIKKALAGEKITVQEEKKLREATWRPQKIKSLKTDFNSVKKDLNQSDIIFYDDGSAAGRKLMEKLRKEDIRFTLISLNKLGNAAYFNMSSRLAALGYGNITVFPVIEYRGEMIMNPSVDEVKVLIIEMMPQ